MLTFREQEFKVHNEELVDGGRGWWTWNLQTVLFPMRLHHSVESSVNRSTFYLHWPELIKKFPTILQ